MSLFEERLCLFPIVHPTLDKFCARHRSTYWTPEEIDWVGDRKDWKGLPQKQRECLKLVLSFFAIADGIVMENITLNFAEEFKAPEARGFYAIQNCMEAIHVITYNLAIVTLMPDPAEHLPLLSNVPRYESVQAKKAFAEAWFDKGISLPNRLVAFACVEGILFSASFCLIYWYKTHNLLSGLTVSNELISRDEALHTDFAVELHRLMEVKARPEDIRVIVKQAVAAECLFVREAVQPGTFEGDSPLTAEDMVGYVQFIADGLLRKLGVAPVYGNKLPEACRYMDMIGVDQKTNFFESRVTSYHKHEPSRLDTNDFLGDDF